MRRPPLAEGMRWLDQADEDLHSRYPNSLPDDIPAHVYTRRAADEAVALAADAVAFVEAQLQCQAESDGG